MSNPLNPFEEVEVEEFYNDTEIEEETPETMTQCLHCNTYMTPDELEFSGAHREIDHGICGLCQREHYR